MRSFKCVSKRLIQYSSFELPFVVKFENLPKQIRTGLLNTLQETVTTAATSEWVPNSLEDFTGPSAAFGNDGAPFKFNY